MVEECGHGEHTGVYVVWVYGGYSWGLEPASCGKWFMRHSSLLGRHCLSDITQWTLQAAGAWTATRETHQYWNFDGGF